PGHAVAGPGVEEVAGGDGAAGAPGLPDRPVLVERGGALDRRGVVPGRLVDVVGAAVAGDGALVGAGGPVAAPVVGDVVLDQRIGGPAVQGQVAVAGGVEAAGVGHRLTSAGAPALAGDEVPGVAPGRAVGAGCSQRHGDRSGAIGPEGV